MDATVGSAGLVPVLAACLAAAAGDNLVHNGDFEASGEGVPAGWVMWGARQYKIPANFTRDLARPYRGKACFRMHHPAGTAGYVVTDPRHAIRPAKGKSYVISFRARADRPGPSVFYLEAYASFRPYRDAPSPGRFPFQADLQWRPFSFEIVEGRDFLAERSPLILLAFRVTGDIRLTKTLWIDDVTMIERPAGRTGLVDERGLEVQPLEHRLRPGQQLAITLSPDKRLRRATRRAAGVSFHRVAGYGRHPYDRAGRYVLEPALAGAIRDMRLPMTRFYGVGDEPFGLEPALDKAAKLCRAAGIPTEATVLELEEQSATRKLAPSVWAKAASYVIKKGYGFHWWEVANEPYTRKATAFASPDDYVAHVKQVAEAVRAVQPEAKIGLSIHPPMLAWGSYVLKQAAGSYDFVVGHHYCSVDSPAVPFEDAVLRENYRVLGQVLRVNALIRACNPAGGVVQCDTEWGLVSSGAKGTAMAHARRSSNILGMLHRAVRLIYYAREGMVAGASSWEMFCRLESPMFAVLSRDAPENRSLIYWLYYHFNRHAGEWVVPMTGTAPYLDAGPGEPPEAAGPITPVLATISDDGKELYIVAANGSWRRDVPCVAASGPFRPAAATAVCLSADDPNGPPFPAGAERFVRKLPVEVRADGLRFDVPAHSVVFVTVRCGP